MSGAAGAERWLVHVLVINDKFAGCDEETVVGVSGTFKYVAWSLVGGVGTGRRRPRYVV